ncbi:MAG: lysophospholipid acyltransferase family protein, partial [Hyphomonadaceae bacterium]
MAVSTKVLWHHPIEAWAFDLYANHFSAMPFEMASDAGADWLARLGPLTPTHKTALRNIRLAYPDESEAWRQELAREQWAQLGRVAAEYPHLWEMTFKADDPRTELIHGERLEAVRASGKGAVFISGHFASFELMPVAIVRREVPCAMT